MKITTLILLFSCRLCSGVDPPVLSGKEADVKSGPKETGLRQSPLSSPSGGSHASRPGLNVQRNPPPRSGGLMETTTRGTLPGAKPTGTQTAVGRSTTKVTVNSRYNTHPDIEDIGEDLEEDLKHVKAYHENRQEAIKTTLEATTDATEPKEKQVHPEETGKFLMETWTIGFIHPQSLTSPKDQSPVMYTHSQDIERLYGPFQRKHFAIPVPCDFAAWISGFNQFPY
ncbi:signal peptide containing protein [Theileria equi strain WA]|uniref:Signal peptide containing protein n=1 Tax=Theileria equi strain WA TaxID=1537102 RepID=L1LAE0_THEEQ|nr:signal peptide containing protein [Theileria equi strain WA]EKX72143.1 signal peptide containing protein [Theileria equi strain WA]|eukprot:XP_004831595.1 signal peptide containing protein [Theileria equi strain WA]